VLYPPLLLATEKAALEQEEQLRSIGMIWRSFLSLLFVAGSTFGSGPVPKHRVDPRNQLERIMVVLPMIGSGTWNDPRRPLFAPTEASGGPRAGGIIGFSYQLSDDGQFAITEFVGKNRSAFQPIFADVTHSLKIFERGKSTRADREAEFRKYKKDFDLDKFGAPKPVATIPGVSKP